MSLAKRDNLLHTYGDYLTWSDDARYELIDGVAYLMSPAPDIPHQDIAGEIYVQLVNQLGNKNCSAYIAPVDVRLPKRKEADAAIDTVVQPDVLVVCDKSKIDRRGIRGAPDFVVEVTSPSTSGHDHVRKRALYERAGVREFWLIHPGDRLLTRYLLAGAEYGKPDVLELGGETPVAVLPDVTIKWDELLLRLPPLEI